MKKLAPFLGLLIGVSLVWAADWKVASPDYRWSFPEDHWAHRAYRTEWWYFTGHLAERNDPERRFGYQFTLFRIGLLTERPDFDSNWTTDSLIMGHAAVTDPQRGEHRFSELLFRETPLLGQFTLFPDPRIAWAHGPVGTSEKWTLDWNARSFDFAMSDDRQGMAFELTTQPLKHLVLQGPNGFSRKGDEPGAASLYYSFTRLATEGTLRVDGESLEVRGESWMDKEFSSSQLAEEQQGWDWFSLQLDDGRDLMIYVLRAENGTPDFAQATLVTSDGRTRYLGTDAWSVVATNSWKSAASGAIYPSRWTINVPEEDLSIDVRPVLSDQENRSRLPGGVYYWEGAVDLLDASGDRMGQGYVELTGYGENSRPPV